MKTNILISCALVGALAACSHKSGAPPQSPDTATNTSTSVTASYTEPRATDRMATPPFDSSMNEASGPIATTGVGDESAVNGGTTAGMTNAGSATNGTTTTNGSTTSDSHAWKGSSGEAALNEPQANAKPVQPSAASAPTRAKSATDQGESKDEVRMTASIRKRMMSSKTLSFGAKNIKVVTQGTSVTLIGSVKSDAEKNEIEGIARNTDGVTNVDDRLVVKQ